MPYETRIVEINPRHIHYTHIKEVEPSYGYMKNPIIMKHKPSELYLKVFLVRLVGTDYLCWARKTVNGSFSPQKPLFQVKEVVE